jgi:PAS domain
MIQFLPPAEIASPLVREFLVYWQLKAAGRFAPRPSEIEPGEIKRLLPYLAISDVMRDPFDLRFRLVGTGIVEAVGEDFTGKRFSEMRVTTGRDTWLAHYARVVNQKGAFYGRYRGELGLDSLRFVDHAAFPLSSDGETVGRIIEIEDWSGVRGVRLGKLETPTWKFEALG